MSVLKPVKILAVLCTAVFVWSSCQKDVSSTNDETGEFRLSGLVKDDPGQLSKVTLLMSPEYAGIGIAERGKDTDRDGIPDSRDLCKTQKENYNGYQDTDGCPDSPPVNTDSDGDGILDPGDACPSQAETVNGYQDSDGCPDSPPVDTTIIEPPQVNLPSSYQLAMPPVGQQGAEFSCVAWAVSYARSAERYYKAGATSYSLGTNIFSPEYVYNQVKASSECSSGSGIYTSLNLLMNQGVCSWETMPYSDANGCSLLPNITQSTEANNFRINSFAQVSLSDPTAIKTLLSQNHPLIAGTSIDDNFTNATAGMIWNSFNGVYGSNHGYVICGYDDSRHAYKVINSWGTSWGDNGYTWIDYDFFGTLPGTLYVITSAN